MYQLKHYSKDQTFKRVINPRLIKSKIQFSGNVGAGLGNLNLILDLPTENEDYIVGDLIEVYASVDPIQILIYVGYVAEINRLQGDFEEMELVLYGLGKLLSKLVYNDAGAYNKDFNQDPQLTANEIINYVNTHYNYFTLDSELVGTSINYTADYFDCAKILRDLVGASENYYYYVDNYNIRFKPRPLTASHTFTLAKNVVELQVDDDDTKLVNKLVLLYNNGASQKIYLRAGSIATYGVREKVIRVSQIKNVAGADEYANNYLNEFEVPTRKIALLVNLNYSTGLLPIDSWGEIDTLGEIDLIGLKTIFLVKPGDTCKIRNTKIDLSDNLFITKIDYQQELIKIELNDIENFISYIKE